MREELELISLEDHEWKLKSWYQDGKYVVVLHCSECSKDFGGKSGVHSKDRVTNLFSNFQIRPTYLQLVSMERGGLVSSPTIGNKGEGYDIDGNRSQTVDLGGNHNYGDNE